MLHTFWFGCQAEPSSTAPPEPFRVAVLTDTHVIGPQYACCSENGDLDNNSIVHTVDRLRETVARLNAVRPAPELVFVLGDVVHDAHVFPTLEEYEGVETAWSLARDLLGELDMPYHIAWGNHDYDFSCDGTPHTRDLTHALFETYLGRPPTEQVDHRGWRFLLANSQLGPTFDAADPRCDGGIGSFGHEQLEWLRDALAEGLPSLVLSHHYLVVSARDEDPDGHGDFESVLAGAPNLKLALAGHMHRWVSLDTGAVRQEILGGTRYDADNFWLLQLSPGGGVEILDEEKGIPFTTCAETWTYDGVPRPADDTVETGDCGN